MDTLSRAEYARLMGVEDIAKLIVSGWDSGFPVSDGSGERELIDRLLAALATPTTPEPDPRGTCWFCKGRFVVDALIAGYDTWDESRLACLACNERMSGNWRPVATPEPDQ